MLPGDQLDGYTVLRLIGRGGYGEVWLCRSDAVGDLRALKFLPASGPELLQREFGALGNYRKAASRLRSPHLMPVEHVGRTAAGLCYVMPLADGTGATDPSDPAWQPLTFAALIAGRAGAATWFTCREIADLMRPVLEALQTLADAGLVHRDVKPDNILFFGGQPCLGDISLVDEDSATLTRRGTPGYLTPSWYAGGHPDMFAAAATLYTLLTGNLPDRMGRAAFTGPPQGGTSLSKEELAERKRLHAVIRRATDERPAERFPDFLAMADTLDGIAPVVPARRLPAVVGVIAALAVVALAVAVLAGVLVSRGRSGPGTGQGTGGAAVPSDTGPQPTGGPPDKAAKSRRPSGGAAAAPELTEGQRADYTALAAMVQGYLGDREYANALASVDTLLATYPQARTQPGYSISRAAALAGLGRVEDAKAELRKEVHVSPKIAAMAARKDLWEKLGDLEDAEKDLTGILNKFGPESFVLFLRADVRAKREDFAGVYADRQAAFAIRPDDPEQKRLVETMWAPLEEKYPGYAEHLKSIGVELSPQAPESVPSGEATGADGSQAMDWIWSLDDESWVFEEFTEADRQTLSAKAYKARVDTSNAVQNAFLNGENQRALGLLDQMLHTQPVYGNQPGISLFRAVLLKRLGRLPEMEAELRKSCHQGPDWNHLTARIYLWDLLGRWRDAEEFLTRLIDKPPGGAGEFQRHALNLLKYRATMRARLGDFPGVAADRAQACAVFHIPPNALLEPRAVPAPLPVDSPGAGASLDINEYVDVRNRMLVGEAWRVIEEAFPAYAGYVKAHPPK